MVISPKNNYSKKGVKAGFFSDYFWYEEDHSPSTPKGHKNSEIRGKTIDPFIWMVASFIFVISFVVVYKLGHYLVSLL